MELKLERPLVFFDFETTGTDREQDRIVEFAFIKVFPDDTRKRLTSIVNPTIPIPAEATYIHGIDDEKARAHPTFAELANQVYSFIVDCDMVGFGSNTFDAPLLYNELRRAGIEWEYAKVNFIDAGNIFKIQNPRNLFAAYRHYCNKDHVDEHTAISDVQATLEVFFKQCEQEDMPNSMSDLALYSNYGKKLIDLSGKFVTDTSGEIIFNFGKHRGQPAKNHLDFVHWMVNKGNFSEDTKRVCFSILNPEPTVDVQDDLAF